VATVGYVVRCPILCGVYLEGAKMSYRFEIDGDKDGYWSRIVASNGETTHVSEQYATKQAAIKTAERLLVDILEQNRVGNRIEIRDVTGEEPAL
jgi:uncharacterized protein YegP (UPF0339 family)